MTTGWGITGYLNQISGKPVNRYAGIETWTDFEKTDGMLLVQHSVFV